MTDWLLNFVAGMAFISLAAIGLVIVAILFLRWLSTNTNYTFDIVSQPAEHQIDNLRDEAIGDMFDVARASRVQQSVDTSKSEEA